MVSVITIEPMIPTSAHLPGLFLFLMGVSSSAFIKAPGKLTLKVGIAEFIEDCIGRTCQYYLDICIGSGRSVDEECVWVPTKNFSGLYQENHGHLAKLVFEADNIRSSFYINANWTFMADNIIVKRITFKDNIIQYDIKSGIKRELLHSEMFTSMSVEIDVVCKLGFYPESHCTTSCFALPGVHDCDRNGTVVCLPGYVQGSLSGTCIKNTCASNPDMCQNNSTCVNEPNSVKCVCQQNFFGTACEHWDPCKEHRCQNQAICASRPSTKDYVCKCLINYSGRYCENIVDPCMHKDCPVGLFCQKTPTGTVCVNITEPKAKNLFQSRNHKNQKATSPPMIAKVNSIIKEEIEPKAKETVKLIQYPVQKDFTTISVIVILLVFLVCCLGVTFLMQRYKYLQKRKKYCSYPNIPTMPSVINMPSYRSADDNFKRWHSLDDSSFFVCHQPNNDHFSTLSYKSGSNLWPHDLYKDSFRNWSSTMKARMPMMNESTTFESEDNTGNLNDISQSNSEKLEGFPPDCMLPDNVESES